MDLSNYVIVSSRCGSSLAARDTVEPADLTVDLSYCVIDVSTGCVLSLVARDTVAPAVEKLTGTSSPFLAARVTVALAVEKLTDTSLVQVKDE